MLYPLESLVPLLVENVICLLSLTEWSSCSLFVTLPLTGFGVSPLTIPMLVRADEMPEAKIPRQKDDPKKYVGVHNQELWEGFCTKHGLIVPFLNVSFSKEAIQRITIAPMVEYEIAKKSIRELLECQRIKNVQIYKSTIPIRF